MPEKLRGKNVRLLSPLTAEKGNRLAKLPALHAPGDALAQGRLVRAFRPDRREQKACWSH